MQLRFGPTRLTRVAILAVAGATVLFVGACHKAKSPEASSPPESVSGQVASVSDSTVQVAQATGTATVDVSSSAKIDEFSKAQLADIAAGNCVRVDFMPNPAAGGAETASSVQRTVQGDDGKCWHPKTVSPGQTVNGTVDSVEGNTINVTFSDAEGNPAQAHVTVTDTTQYSKDIWTTPQAIQQGKCITARGNKDKDGTLQATSVTLGATQNGKCPQPAAK